MKDKQTKKEVLNNQEETEKQYKLAIEVAPKDADTHFKYGNFLEEMGRSEEAEEQYIFSLKLAPSNADTHFNYGILLAEMRRWKEAEEQYKPALEADPNNVATHSNYGILLAEMERFKEAEEQYKLALEINPNYADVHCNYGNLLAELARLEEAEEQYKLALDIDPKHVNTHNDYGTFLEGIGRWEEAEEQYKLALEINPNTATYTNYGILLAEMERFKEAEEQYKLALRINPNDADVYCNYGNLLAELARLEEAEEQYKFALEADPNDIATYYNYGTLLTEIGRQEETIELYNQALEIKPPYNRRNLIYRAFILESVGRNGEAANIFSSVASLENKVKNEGIIKVADFKKNALKEKDTDKKVDVLNEIVNAFLQKREFFVKGIENNESMFKNFIDSKRSIPADSPSFLSILRKWNSYTPILPSIKNNSKGGGYFLYHCGKGIVIDPGFNFIENFYKEGFKVADIDAVMITHAHNDHTVDLESILTLVYKHNDAIEDAVKMEMKGEDKVKIQQEIEKRLKQKGKKIDLFMNVGTFMKFSGWLNIKDSNEINTVTVLMPNKRYDLPEEYNGISVYTTKAKHNEIVSNQYAIGLIFDIAGVNRIGFTGDSGWDYDQGEVMVEPFKKLKPKLVIAHLGSIKSKEFKYVDPGCEAKKNDCFYSQHLGLLGITKFLNETKPDLTIISEFGEELKGMRIQIADILSKVLKIKYLPGDIGLHIRLKDLGIFCIIEQDFVDYNQIQTSSSTQDDSTLCYHKNLSYYLDGSESLVDIFNKACSREKTGNLFRSLKNPN